MPERRFPSLRCLNRHASDVQRGTGTTEGELETRRGCGGRTQQLGFEIRAPFGSSRTLARPVSEGTRACHG